jgi:hypothetical protein
MICVDLHNSAIRLRGAKINYNYSTIWSQSDNVTRHYYTPILMP